MVKRILVLHFLAMTAFAAAPDGNAVQITSATAQFGRPIDVHRFFPESGALAITNHPKPFMGGVGPATWQAKVKQRWGNGNVKLAHIWGYTTIAASASQDIDFRNSSVACEGGACGTPLSQSEILAKLNSGWGASVEIDAYPQGTTTTCTVDARSLIAAGNYTVRMAGPAATQIVVEDISTSLGSDCGFHDRRSARLITSTSATPTDLVFDVDAPHWANITTPFTITADGEDMRVCFVDAAAKKIYLGDNHGTSSSCPASNGRGYNSTTAVQHYIDGAHSWGKFLYLAGSMYLASDLSSSSTSIAVNDASSVSSFPTVLRIGAELVSVCGKSGNTFTVGTATPCVATTSGRQYYGTNPPVNPYTSERRMPVYNWSTATDVWVNAAAEYQKSLHVTFVITIPTLWDGVGIEYHVANPWTARMQDQEVTMRFYRGTGASKSLVATKTFARLLANTFVKYPDGPELMTYTNREADRKIWDGNVPGALTWDLNLRYLRTSKSVFLDPDMRISQAALTMLETSGSSPNPPWSTSSKCAIETGAVVAAHPLDFGFLERNLEDTGTRYEIGPHDAASLIGLGAMGRTDLTNYDKALQYIHGGAACKGYIPSHFWESNTSNSLKFCAGGETGQSPTSYSCTGSNLNVAAFGRPLSIDARPGIAYIGSQTNSTDLLSPVGYISYNYINTGSSFTHWPASTYIAWLISGDWYYERIIQDEASFALFQGPEPGYDPNNHVIYAGHRYRHGAWGLMVGFSAGDRQVAWALRSLHQAAFVSDDGTPDQQFYAAKMASNAEAREGALNITNGNYYRPCVVGQADDYTKWCYGKKRIGYDTNNVAANRFYWWSINGYEVENTNLDTRYNFFNSSLWGTYYNLSQLKDAENHGFTQFAPARKEMSRWIIGMLQDPVVGNHFVGDVYRAPGVPCSPEGTAFNSGCSGQNLNGTTTPGTEFLFSSLSNWYSFGFSGTAKARTTFDTDQFAGGGRARLLYGAAALGADLSSGSLSGQRAFNWVRGNLKYANIWGDNPQWAFSPEHWYQAGLKVNSVGSTSATLRVARPETAKTCKYALSRNPITHTLYSGYTSISNAKGLRDLAVTRSDLVPGMTYYAAAACDTGAITDALTFTTTKSTPLSTYYVDAVSGNNSNTGESSDLALRDCTAVNALSLQPGNFVLLKRGTTQTCTITVPASGSSGSPITFSAYGTGADPIIDGSDALSGFVTATGPVTTWIQDTFTRSASNGWGTPNTGAAWTVTTGTAANFSVNGSVARYSESFGYGRMSIATTPTGTVVYQVDFSNIPNLDRQFGFDIRVQNSGQNYYRVFWQRDTHTLYIVRNINGSGTTIASQSKADPGSSGTFKVQIANDGSGNPAIDAKFWTGTEPGSWDVSVTDSNAAKIATDGTFALELGNDGSTTAQADNLLVQSPAISYSTTYQVSLAADPGDVVLEDGVPMAKRASVAAVDANPGSFYYSGGVLYLKATGSGNPNSNGKAYRAAVRSNAINTSTRNYITIDGLELRGAKDLAVSGSGSNVILSNATIRNVNNGAMAVSGANGSMQTVTIANVLSSGATVMNLAGANSSDDHVTVSGVPSTSVVRQISSTGYVGSYSNITLPDSNAAYVTKMTSGVTDTPNLHHNTYSRSTIIQGLHQSLAADGTYRTQRLALLSKVGAKLSRESIRLTLFASGGAGVYDWTRFDAQKAEYLATSPRIKVLYTLMTESPFWMNSSSCTNYVPGNNSASDSTFLAWEAAQVTAFRAWLVRYQDVVEYIEVGNEINQPDFWNTNSSSCGYPNYTAPTSADQQRHWVNAMTAMIRSVKPSIKIGITGITGLGASSGAYSDGIKFLQHLYDDTTGGALNTANFDAVAVHPYTDYDPTTIVLYQQRFKGLQDVYDDIQSRPALANRVKVWATEWSWYANSDESVRIDYTQKAMAILRTYPFVTLSAYFQDIDQTPDYPTSGLFGPGSSFTAHSLAESWALEVSPRVDYKGTIYSVQKAATTLSTESNLTVQ